MCFCVCGCVCVCVYIGMGVCVFLRVWLCVYVGVGVFLCVWLCVFLYGFFLGLSFTTANWCCCGSSLIIATPGTYVRSTIFICIMIDYCFDICPGIYIHIYCCICLVDKLLYLFD